MLSTLRTTVVEYAQIVGIAAVTCPATRRATIDLYVQCIWTYVKKACASAAIFKRLATQSILVLARAVVGVLSRYRMQTNVSHRCIIETSALSYIGGVVWIIVMRRRSFFRYGRNSSSEK